MRPIYSWLIFIIQLCLFPSFTAKGQARLATYIDAGKSNISEGFYTKTAILGQYQLGKTRIAGSSQFDIKSASTKVFTGLNLNVAHEFSIKEFPFEIQGIFLYSPFSDVIHESNWGLLLDVERTHFHFRLGSNFRTYRITNEAAETYNITENRSLHENWNLMYLIGYNLKSVDHPWNIGISITNIDHFLINQETNPMFNLNGKYDISTLFTVVAEMWYKSAGSMNISANYFGYFFRTGLIWRIN